MKHRPIPFNVIPVKYVAGTALKREVKLTVQSAMVAPAILVNPEDCGNDPDIAVTVAMQRTRLNDFKGWRFIALRYGQVKSV